MTSTKSTMTISRTCCTVIGGMLFMRLLSTNCGHSPININCVSCVDEDIILSDSIYKTYSSQKSISYSVTGYNLCKNRYSGIEKVFINEEKIYNLKKLDQIANLEDGWNGDDAAAFNNILIAKVRSLITSLDIQPELFPTACDSIQIEYEKEDGSYLEFELNLGDTWEVFEINSAGEERYFSVLAEVEAVNKVVNVFYG